MMEYDFLLIEKKWQKYWEDKKTYQVSHHSSKPKYYILDMFPYPSGAGLHVGHPLGYIASDIVSRYKRLKGFNVLHPMGFDSFGLPAEQYAIQTGQHPAITTEKNIKRYKEQLRALGFSYDWSRELRTSDPSFYKWTQWIFKLIYASWYSQKEDKALPIESLIQILEKRGNKEIQAAATSGTPIITAADWNSYTKKEQEIFLLNYRLAYLAETTVNWCPKLGTVLANDEIKDGFSIRGGYPVELKEMPQWNMRITAYAERLLSGLDKIEWAEPIKEIQRNWIGKSYGVDIDFKVAGSETKIKIFTTRIDTIFGVTFLVVAPENKLVKTLTIEAEKDQVENYLNSVENRSERERISENKRISGVFTGSYVRHPLSGNKLPVYIADYVLVGYGTGAIMAVPSGDQRDFDFAKHFGLPITIINDAQRITNTKADATKGGKMIHSDFLNGLSPTEAIEQGIQEVEKRGIGVRKTNYKLRDAIFGRQRYWGEPMPIYYVDGVATLVSDEDLALNLPKIDAYIPTEKGEPPLGRASDWSYHGNPYELSTMPGWAGSSWYFFRYMDSTNEKVFCSREALDYWQDVDVYVGGIEHATGHLLYSRFWTKFLFDRGYIQVDEYAKKLVNQGMIQGRSNFIYQVVGEDRFVSYGLKKKYETFALPVDIRFVKDDILDVEAFKKEIPHGHTFEFILENGKYHCGWEIEKMSKSKMNVVNPDTIIERYGADTLRMYEMFLGPIEQSKPWNTNGIEGVFKFLRKFWSLFYRENLFTISESEPTKGELKILHETIKKIAEDIDRLSLNTSVSRFMISVNELSLLKCNKRSILEPLTIVLAPFAPHLSEEIWCLLGHQTSILYACYPLVEERYLVNTSIEYPISVNGKMRTKISFSSDSKKEAIEKEVLANEIIQKWLDGKSPKKVVIVSNKIVNIVV